MSTTGHPATQIINAMSRDEARVCVTEIRQCLDSAGTYVERAEELAFALYEREGWKPLGYPTWIACMETEIPGKSRARYYQLLKSGTTLRELTEPSESNQLDSEGTEAIYALSERHLQELTPLADYQRLQAIRQARAQYGGEFSARQLHDVAEELLYPFTCSVCSRRLIADQQHCERCGLHFDRGHRCECQFTKREVHVGTTHRYRPLETEPRYVEVQVMRPPAPEPPEPVAVPPISVESADDAETVTAMKRRQYLDDVLSALDSAPRHGLLSYQVAQFRRKVDPEDVGMRDNERLVRGVLRVRRWLSEWESFLQLKG